MSAIAIVFNRQQQPVDMTIVELMLAASPGRAVDGQASWRDGSLAMAHQHFWITPEEVGEDQPLVDAEAGLSIVADVRLDNRLELVAALDLLPGEGRALSDAALLLRAYRRWGPACVERLLGDFAFAIWDAADRSLFLARDPLGARGLVYYIDDQRFLAASEIKQIVAHPAVYPELNQVKVASYLAVQWDDQEQTFYQSIYYCPPAHCMLVSDDTFRKWRYWDLDPGERLRYRDDAEYAEAFLHLLNQAVSSRMRTAYKIGISLSGGLDSAAVAALAAGALAQNHSGQQRLLSISYVFDELMDCDERAYIAPLAESLDLETTFIPGDGLWPLRDLARWPSDPDFVHHDPYILLPLAVAEEASRADCRVLLTGHFGDWLYLGSAFWAADLLRERRLGGLLKILIGRQAPVDWRRDLFENGLRQLRPGWLQSAYRRINPRPARWPNPGLPRQFMAQTGLLEARQAAPVSNDFPTPDLERRYHYLTDAILAQGMACVPALYNQYGVERVDPFFDRRLMEFVFALPADQLGRPGRSRLVLRNALGDRLPDALSARADKTDFQPLFDKGVRDMEQQVVNDLMRDPQIARRGFVDHSWLRRSLATDWSDVGYFIWLYISLELWLRRHWSGGRSTTSGSGTQYVSQALGARWSALTPETDLVVSL